MNIGGEPPTNNGEFHLLRKQPDFQSSITSPAEQNSQATSQDQAPASAAAQFDGDDFPFRSRGKTSSSPTFAPHNFFPQNPIPNPNLNPDFSSRHAELNYASRLRNLQFNRFSPSDDVRNYRFIGDNYNPKAAHRPGFLPNGPGNDLQERLGHRGKIGNSHVGNGLGIDRKANGFRNNSIEINVNARENRSDSRVCGLKTSGNGNRAKQGINREVGHRRRFDCNVNNDKSNFGDLDKNHTSRNLLDSHAPYDGSNLRRVSASDIVEHLYEETSRNIVQDRFSIDQESSELDDLESQIMSSLGLEDELDEKSDKKDEKVNSNKDYRSDNRGQLVINQRMRNLKRMIPCRSDIMSLNGPFLAVFESLIPTDQQKFTLKQFLATLEKLVLKKWPDARLYLYGSCGNSFAFSKSDIDVCIYMGNTEIDKTEVLLKLAEILESDNFQNVQALTRARVPIVKLMDPLTFISCDICVNNLLAVVNTKLIRDYAQIDVRLRQLAFIIKHWAKSRGVNETYRGTLSSYAYVLMCINFLQQRRPAILPCLQEMNITYIANMDDVECAYFDEVEKLGNFGARNSESIGQLVWAFFHYWAYCHDYANDVISVRTGSTLSKRGKDWTRRVGNDRHLICIEDPFEVSHDLGRVVNRYSIRVIREEFERATQIMHNNPNPCAALFEPYLSN